MGVSVTHVTRDISFVRVRRRKHHRVKEKANEVGDTNKASRVTCVTDAACLACSPPASRGQRATVSPTLAHVASDPRPLIGEPTRRGPVAWGLGCKAARLAYTALARANLPRWAFTKRLTLPLTAISRAMAEYKVAAGVLPLGEVQ